MSLSDSGDVTSTVWLKTMLFQWGSIHVKGSCSPLFPPLTSTLGYRRCSCDIGNSHQFTAPKKVSRWRCCHFNKAPGQRVACVCSQDFSNCSIMMYYKSEFHSNWTNKPRSAFALENKSVCLHESVWDCDSCELNSLFFSGMLMSTKKRNCNTFVTKSFLKSCRW